jgi:hypothetical protein
LLKYFIFVVGLLLFSSLCLIGSILLAVGALFQGSAALLPVMLLGRLLFGCGNGSLTSKCLYGNNLLPRKHFRIQLFSIGMIIKDYPKTKGCYSQAVTYDNVVMDLHGEKIQFST